MWTRIFADQGSTCVSGIGKKILYHRATREAQGWILTHRRDACGKEEEKAQHFSFQHRLGLTEVPGSEHLNLVLGGKNQEGGKLADSNAEPIPVNSLASHKSSWEERKLAQPEPSDQHVFGQSQEHSEHTHVTYFQQGPSVCGFEVRTQLTVP